MFSSALTVVTTHISTTDLSLHTTWTWTWARIVGSLAHARRLQQVFPTLQIIKPAAASASSEASVSSEQTWDQSGYKPFTSATVTEWTQAAGPIPI